MNQRLFTMFIVLFLLFFIQSVHPINAQNELPSVGDFYTTIPVWNPSNSLVAKVSDTNVEIWENNSSSPTSILTGHTDTVLSLSWSDNGNYLATGSADSTVRIWEVATGNTITIYTGHNNSIASIDWQSDGTQIASVSAQGDQNLHIWDALTGDLIISGKGGSASAIRFSANNMEIAAVIGPIIVIRSVSSLEITKYFRTDFLGSLETEDEDNWMQNVKWNPDGSKLVTNNIIGSIYIWDANTLQPLNTLIATDAYNPEGINHIEQLAQTWVRDVAFNFDGSRVLSASSDGTIRVWDSETYEELQTIQVNPMLGAGWTNDGEYLATISETNEVNFLDTTSLANPITLTIPALSVISNTTDTIPTFTWSVVTGAEFYLLSVSSSTTSAQESFVATDVCNASECSATLDQPLALGTYTASVQAVNANTTSDPSNEITFTILDSQPIVIDPIRLCPVDTPVIDFNSNPPFSYGATQDVNGQVVIEDEGTTLRLTGNTWQQVNFPYTVTSQTVIDFDFQSNTQGELHGMGFDTASNDQKISKKKVYTVYGTQNWGRSDGGRYDEFAPDTTHFGITVGADYTGDVNYLTFVNDHDVDNPTAESVFSNVQICEFVEPVPPLDPTSCSAQAVLAYAPGQSLASDGLLHPDRMDPSNALGEAQGTDTLNFVSLGYGGELILDMGQRIMNEDGDDLRVIETTYTDTSRSWLVYPEQAIVYASQDLESWVALGVARKDMGFDLGSLDWARYIRIVDATNPGFFIGNGTTTDAFDVDAVEAISTCSP